MKSSHLTLEHMPLLQAGNFLEDFVSSLPFSAGIKDATTGKYLLGNLSVTSHLGLSPQEYVGLTIYDWQSIAKLSAAEVKRTLELDHQIYKEGVSANHVTEFLDHTTEYVTIHQVVRKPISSPIQPEKIVAIFTYSQNITDYLNPMTLYDLYQHYYPTTQAIQLFLRYLELETCFNKLPANRELMTLLAMRENSASKYVADTLDINSRTAEEYKARLRDKLKVIGLDELLIRLRKRPEYKYESIN